MLPPYKECFRLYAPGFVLIVTVLHVSSLAEGNQHNRDIDDRGQSYFFYQQSEYPRDCLEVISQCSSSNSSGVYAIKPDGYPEVFDVYCDSEGYTVIERRMDRLIDFNRSWEEYETGFGFISHEFWLGNQRLSYLTNQKNYQLRIDVTLNDGSTFYVTYDNFRVSDAHSNYKLISTGQYDGTIVKCPANMLSDTCTSQITCADPDSRDSACHVTGSCVCPDGFLLDNGHCVRRSQCGCFIAEAGQGQGIILQEGGVYVSPHCSERCSCTSGQLDCQNDFQCSPHGSCGQNTNGWNCSCNSNYEGDGIRCTPIVTATDCQDIFRDGQTSSGLYYINPPWSPDPFQVYCNMADGGGWTVFQRQDGSDDFYRDWSDYKNGFGSLERGMWLGNEKIHNLTSQKDYQLRIDLTNSDGGRYYALYSLFRINGESDKYRLLSVGSFSGTVGSDKLSWNVNKQFSTRDQDNDGWSDYDCAVEHEGGWWFGEWYFCTNSESYCRARCPTVEGYCEHFPVGNRCAGCTGSYLNANYNSSTRGRNVFWEHLPGFDCRIQYTEMRIRPV